MNVSAELSSATSSAELSSRCLISLLKKPTISQPLNKDQGLFVDVIYLFSEWYHKLRRLQKRELSPCLNTSLLQPNTPREERLTHQLYGALLSSLQSASISNTTWLARVASKLRAAVTQSRPRLGSKVIKDKSARLCWVPPPSTGHSSQRQTNNGSTATPSTDTHQSNYCFRLQARSCQSKKTKRKPTE